MDLSSSFLPTFHWPEIGHMVSPGYKGGGGGTS